MRQVFERPALVPAHGIVEPGRAARAFTLLRVPPAPDLAHLVERHWVLWWDLPEGDRHTQVVVPHPCVNVVVEADGTRAYGIPTDLFERTLVGAGVVVGTKFRPGAFRPFLGRAMTSFRGRSIPAAQVLGEGYPGPAVLPAARREPKVAVEAVEAALRRHPGATTAWPALELVERVVHLARTGRAARSGRVADLADEAGLQPRALQRLMADHVGVSAKWLLNRHRVHQVAERLATDPGVDLAALATELGYCDQAHLTRDFTGVVGWSPAAYARRCTTASGLAATA